MYVLEPFIYLLLIINNNSIQFMNFHAVNLFLGLQVLFCAVFVPGFSSSSSF